MIGLTLAMWLMAAIEDQRVLVLVSDKAPSEVAALNKRFIIELGLLLDGYALQREPLPAGFDAMTREARIVLARERLEGRAPVALFLELAGDAVDATVVVRDGDRTLSRTARGSADGLESLALGVRELIATAYSWEPERRAAAEPEPVTETVAQPEFKAPPRIDEHALYVDGGIVRSRTTRTAFSGAAGLQQSFASGLELRELVEARLGSEDARDASGDDVRRFGLAARLDAGYRLGNGVLRVVPMVSARFGWQRTSVSPEPAVNSVLATLGGALEARARVAPKAELVLRPEAAWNIAPLQLRRVLTGFTVSDDGAFVWGVRLGVAVYF